jgi:hypothetical protein
MRRRQIVTFCCDGADDDSGGEYAAEFLISA